MQGEELTRLRGVRERVLQAEELGYAKTGGREPCECEKIKVLQCTGFSNMR